MRLAFLGTGSAMPTGDRAQSGLLLADGDDRLLVDCGSGVLGSLARTEAGYEAVDTVLLTHHHLDHVADLLPLLKARWLAGEEHLSVAGPPGTTALLADLLDVHDYLRGRVDLTLRDLDGPFSLAGFEGDRFEGRHSMRSFAYRLTAGDATVAVSGDTEPFPELVEFCDGADVLVHDCSFPDDVDVSNHPTPSGLGDALAAADPSLGRVYLTHLYPHTEGRHEEMLDSIGERYGDDVRVARDGLTVEL